MKKKRLDLILVEQGFFDSREKAKKHIMAGVIFNKDGIRLDKPGMNYPEDIELEIRGKVNPYVSRGGLKLEKAMADYGLDLTDKVCMDIGASTGGFTDCMLQNGAEKVFSVDVGYGQLDWKLRQDERVINMERTNIRHVTAEDIGDPLDFCSIDVSFISLKLVLPVAKSLLTELGELVFLIKPQFEAGREHMKKSGVLRDAKVHKKVLKDVLAFADSMGIQLIGLTFSPIKGPKGNIEFLAYGTFDETVKGLDFNLLADSVVDDAHSTL